MAIRTNWLTFGKELCEALGLDAWQVHTIDLHVSVNAAPTIHIERRLVDGDTEAVTKVLERYHLVAIPEGGD